MKYLSIFVVLMSGCAHISEYSQGCRDGVTELVQLKGSGGGDGAQDEDRRKKYVAYFCDMLDGLRDREKNK